MRKRNHEKLKAQAAELKEGVSYITGETLVLSLRMAVRSILSGKMRAALTMLQPPSPMRYRIWAPAC